MFRIDYIEGGIRQRPIFSNDIRDVGQILINIINNEEIENKAMDWCSKAHFGDKISFKVFTIQCVYDENNVNPPSVINNKQAIKKRNNLKNSEIVAIIKRAEIQKKEVSIRAYTDECWRIDVERHLYGTIRFWIGYEYKDGNCGSDFMTIYRYNGQIKYASEVVPTKKVLNRVLSIFEALEKSGLIKD